MRIIEIMEKKRDGGELSYDELKLFVDAVVSGAIADYQISAMLMAMFIRGLNDRETADLTAVMAKSGDSYDLSSIDGVKADKHSTGGVGDKTTLIVAPIVAACGIKMAKMSGRGLGHTGGTIDKLESIEGFRTALTKDEFFRCVAETGLSVVAQSDNLCPADKKLYALRDVTATINSLPLIASSIMSKKLASGADVILLDVKTGSGAFLKTREEAARLARVMIDIGVRSGKKTAALITDMDRPLGLCVGNELEVNEAISVLKNNGPFDLTAVSVELAARILSMGGLEDVKKCRAMAFEKLRNNEAYLKFIEMVRTQGGRVDEKGRVVFKREELQSAFYVADREGYIASMDAHAVGMAALSLGAGREKKEQAIAYGAGIIFSKTVGEYVTAGETVAVLLGRDQEGIEQAGAILDASIGIDKERPIPVPLILGYLDENGEEPSGCKMCGNN